MGIKDYGLWTDASDGSWIYFGIIDEYIVFSLGKKKR